MVLEACSTGRKGQMPLFLLEKLQSCDTTRVRKKQKELDPQHSY